MNIKFYCDESGNTGVNYIDKRDPFFVLGGWLDINNKSKDSIFLEKLEQILYKESEYKANKLQKSVKGRRKMKEVISFLQENEFYPILTIIDKRFATAARINSILLDHVYNDLADPRIERDEYDIPLYELAEIMDKLSDNALDGFADSYRNLNAENMIKSIEDISSELLRMGYNDLANIIKNSKVKIESNLSDERNISKNQAPNVFALNCLLKLINDICKNDYSVDFIHDVQLQYGENMNEMVKDLAQDREDQVRFAFKNENVFYKAIKSFSFVKSDDNLLLQCSDILVGSINLILKTFIFGQIMDESKQDLFKQIEPYLYGQFCRPSTTFFMISRNRFNELLPNSQEVQRYISSIY
jgi:hypothetical protein